MVALLKTMVASNSQQCVFYENMVRFYVSIYQTLASVSLTFTNTPAQKVDIKVLLVVIGEVGEAMV